MSSLEGYDENHDRQVRLEDEAFEFVNYLNNLKASRPKPVKKEKKDG